MAAPGPKPQTHPDKGLVTPMPVATNQYNPEKFWPSGWQDRVVKDYSKG